MLKGINKTKCKIKVVLNSNASFNWVKSKALKKLLMILAKKMKKILWN